MLSSCYKDDGILEAGIDEAGRGCFWGPMVAAAVIWPHESTWSEELRAIVVGIKDSKLLTAKRRAVAETNIKRYATAWGVGAVSAEEIDELGMTASNRLAFNRALEALGPNFKPRRLLIDGCLYIQAMDGVEQIVEPKADGKYLAVAAASILAKEGRDAMVKDAVAADALLQERYAIGSSKGYGTAKHRDGLLKYGVYQGHRRLFLRNLLGASIYSRPDPDACFIED